MSFRRRLTGRCAILQPTGTDLSAWNTKQTVYVAPNVPTDLRSVPCFFYPMRGAENSQAERKVSIERSMFDFAIETPITTSDRIQYSGQTYEVVAVNPVGGGHHLKVEATQIQVKK